MRKSTVIYLALFALILCGVSCSNDDDNSATSSNSPYAYVKSFSIGNIKSPFHDFTVDGRDTIVEKVVSGDEFVFVVDNKTREVYNADSLTYGTKVNKVVATLSCVGVPYRYDANLGSYVYFSSTDSIDFTSPVNVRIMSTDDTYEVDYTVKVNVHSVDPDLMVWSRFPNAALADIVPVKMFEKGGEIYLFCTDAAGAPLVGVTSSAGTPEWNFTAISAPESFDLASLQLFGEKFYMLASGDVYVSNDAVVWSVASEGNGFVSLFAISGNGEKMWASTAGELYSTADEVAFESVSTIPTGFPIYGCSYTNSSLSTNASINRTMLVGYADAEKQGAVKVWSMLSNSGEWYEYEFGDDKNICPSFERLVVLGYDGAMFAIGGSAVVGEKNLLPFEKFYISRDNGVVWKACTDYALSLPVELKGCDVPFAAMVSQDDYMWIVTPENAWRGKINRLGFK